MKKIPQKFINGFILAIHDSIFMFWVKYTLYNSNLKI